jgi:hypothetical protein
VKVTPTLLPPAPPSPAIGSAITSSYTAGGARWSSVALPVLDAPVGSTMVVTAQRTLQAHDVNTAGTGWACEAPSLTWIDSGLFATARTTCRYVGGGNAESLRFEYQVAPQARLTALLTPPAGSTDDNAADNRVQVVLGG